MVEFSSTTIESSVQEGPRDIACQALARLAAEQNQALGAEFVGENGRLLMSAFARERGGHLSPEEIKICTDRVEEKEFGWSPLMNEQSRQFHLAAYGISSEGKERGEVDAELMACWREEREFKDTALAEVAVSLALSRALKDEYLVVRAAVYDDYVNKVDQYIVRKATGEVVGVVDDVTVSASGERKSDKINQAREIARRGGSKVTFGLTFSHGKPVRRRLTGVPMFALQVDKAQALQMLQELDPTLASSPGIVEQQFASGLIKSMVKQAETLAQDTTVPETLRRTLKSVGVSLSKIEASNAKADELYALAA